MKRLGVEFPFMVGPMVGISHVAFRELVRSYVPYKARPLYFTEMLSTRRLPSQRVGEAETLMTAPGEADLVPQLLGNEESFISGSIKRLLAARPWGFDINMGCPVKHTLSHNWGVRLMGDRKYAAEVVKMTKRHSPFPVSVKLRAGIGDNIDEGYLMDFTESLEDAGADWIALHCRLQARKHTGPSHWEAAGAVAAERKIPVVANGDIQTADEAISIVEKFGVDGAMFGRAAMARPWILAQIARRLGMLSVGEPLPPETPEEEGRAYFESLIKFCDLLENYFGDTPSAIDKLHLHVGIGHRWIPFGHSFFTRLRRLSSLYEIRRMIFQYAADFPQPMTQRVAL